jgi:hypothetical protein
MMNLSPELIGTVKQMSMPCYKATCDHDVSDDGAYLLRELRMHRELKEVNLMFYVGDGRSQDLIDHWEAIHESAT